MQSRSLPHNSFGIVLATCHGDAFLAAACLASIRIFLPDVPVCIIADGGLEVDSWKRCYRLEKVVTRSSTEVVFLRDYCFGSRMTSAVSFWESPFERFMYLDADTILWGNIFENIDIRAGQFIHNIPHEPYTQAILRTQYFTAEKVFQHTRSFDWKGHHYFNSGVFIAEKNLIDLQELKELVLLWRRDRTMFPTDIQGILNLLIFRGASEGRYKVAEVPLQTVIPVIQREILDQEFRIVGKKPLVKFPTVLHWAGQKPGIRNKSVFQEPVEFFRRQHLRNLRDPGRFVPNLAMYFEEYRAIFRHYYKGSWKKLMQHKLTSRRGKN